MKSLSACLLFLVGLVTPILTWASAAPQEQQVVQTLQKVMDHPLTKYSFKLYAKVTNGRICGPTFVLETDQHLGSGQLCQNTLTGERYLSLSLMGCYVIESHGDNSKATTHTVFIFQKNAQAKYRAMLNTGTPNLEILSDQGCRVLVSLPTGGFMTTAVRIVLSAYEM